MFKSTGVKRFFGAALSYIGRYILPNIPETALFAEAVVVLGDILLGVGIAHAAVTKITK